jgi:hypothetical protein
MKKSAKQPPNSTPPARAAGSDLPGVETLAHLAAQARFKDEMMPGNAALAALNLWRECKRILEGQHALEHSDQKRDADKVPPFPKTQPVTLDDFYTHVVGARDENENQPRFKKFLRYTLGTEQAALRSRRDAAQKNANFYANPDDGKDFRDSVARLEPNIVADDAMDAEWERRFEERKTNPFTEGEWYSLASDYIHWWIPEKARMKSDAARKRWNTSPAKKKRKKIAPAS